MLYFVLRFFGLAIAFVFSIGMILPVGNGAWASGDEGLAVCSRLDQGIKGLPRRIYIRVIDDREIELRTLNTESAVDKSVRFISQSFANQPSMALFNIGTANGVTTWSGYGDRIEGDAKIIISQAALKYRSIGRFLITNRTTKELSTYSCY